MDSKIGIIVPYRNRFEHLKQFKQHIVTYLDINGYDNYEIIIVEQDNAKLFNRGMLLNIGFKEAKKLKCDYVVFHDVDMLPVDVDYSHSDTPIHLVTNNIPFESYFGGITLFPSELFEKINGFSNLYWGWGFEDDDLRYRCIKNYIPFQNIIADTFTNKILPIFNGVDAYATIPNIINYNRSFKIQLDINLDRVIYNVNKQFDIFPILTIPGYDFKLFYNSFNRFYLQLFDKKGNYYDVYSDIVTISKNKILIEYNKKENIIIFTVNNIVNMIKLSNHIWNYSNINNIIIGTDSTKESFFKGTINEFLLKENDEVKIHYKNYDIKEYKFTDISDNKIHGKLFNVYLDYFKSFINHYSYIPFRRNSKLLKLKHDDCGFSNGRWKDDNSRWNQLRYNNEVQLGYHDDINDGLSTLQFRLYGKKKENKITHLNVGI
jgi:hypothetical protein